MQDKFSSSIPRNRRCSQMSWGTFAIADGIIKRAWAGITEVGQALQVLAIVVAILSIVLLLLPALPLVTEWPTQWLALVSGLNEVIVNNTAEGTSAGQHSARSDVVVSCHQRGDAMS